MAYIVRVSLTYSTTGNATTALTNINTQLANRGRVERATQAGATVSLAMDAVGTQAEAVTLRDALTPAWSAGPRTAGKASIQLV